MQFGNAGVHSSAGPFRPQNQFEECLLVSQLLCAEDPVLGSLWASRVFAMGQMHAKVAGLMHTLSRTLAPPSLPMSGAASLHAGNAANSANESSALGSHAIHSSIPPSLSPPMATERNPPVALVRALVTRAYALAAAGSSPAESGRLFDSCASLVMLGAAKRTHLSLMAAVQYMHSGDAIDALGAAERAVAMGKSGNGGEPKGLTLLVRGMAKHCAARASRRSRSIEGFS